MFEATEQAGFILPRKFVFPNPKDTPARFSQGAVHPLVTGFVAGQFFFQNDIC